MQTDELVEAVARALCPLRSAEFGEPPCYLLEGSGPVDDPFVWTPDCGNDESSSCRALAQAAIAAARPAILEEGYQRGVTEAYKAVCGTNADMCKSAVAAYRLCVDATNTLRVNYPPAPTAIRDIARGEG